VNAAKLLEKLEARRGLTSLLALSYASIIYYFSSLPTPPTGGLNVSMLLLHFIEYLGFGFVVLLALRGRVLRASAPRIALALSALYAVSDELHQFFVPGRIASVFDVYADWMGCFAGVGLYLLLREGL